MPITFTLICWWRFSFPAVQAIMGSDSFRHLCWHLFGRLATADIPQIYKCWNCTDSSGHKPFVRAPPCRLEGESGQSQGYCGGTGRAWRDWTIAWLDVTKGGGFPLWRDCAIVPVHDEATTAGQGPWVEPETGGEKYGFQSPRIRCEGGDKAPSSQHPWLVFPRFSSSREYRPPHPWL